ncbi:hypothetical protein LTS07_000063 [Exophiala sideris]|uniref:FIST domain-containing protein n=1 Tax=Exophiala sideris TaxID=1016849 RepID=A0ABR0JPP1_9EURO|nr:hypothetical protein LTS07_000063 [Exophiala sideris]KAK5041121.1 hypothetical protein LTR13_002595 [Exophiala sideris]KAK5067946.1 hypothetical protein LTR69_000063 [Exophiala sideris]KAK5187248.1 hypothetical protein LTR44_000063 [Eurotiomycetes sp. CCFEE 6388]
MRIFVDYCARCAQPLKVLRPRPRQNIPAVAIRMFTTKSTLRQDEPAAPITEAEAASPTERVFDRLKRHAGHLSRQGQRSSMTWIAQGNPALVKPEEILPHIVDYCEDRPEKVRTIVLLATPALSHFLDPERLLKPLIEALYHDVKWYKRSSNIFHVNTVTAVVDAIPVPRSAETKANLATAEGLSLLLSGAPPANRAPDDEDNPANLRFISNSTSTSLTASGRSVNRHVSLPVANTLFVNGQKTTFMQHDWRIRALRHGSSVYPLSQNHRQYVKVRIQCEADEFVGGHIPLRPLTPVRKVMNSMGNILAQIQIDGKAVPASKELETAVPDYLASNPGVTQGPGLVYALIRPPNMKRAADQEHDTTDGSPTSALPLALWRGARLHKVTGGGGGWGKKQGLLSLDAGSDFKDPRFAGKTIHFPDPDDDDSMPTLKVSQDTIPDGSTVEFLVRTNAEVSKLEAEAADPKEPPAIHDEQSDSAHTTRNWVFGTAQAPDTHASHTEDSSEESSGVVFFPNYFGMVSFSGAALGSEEVPGPDEVYSPDCPPFRRTRTLLDVPDIRLNLVS